MTNMTNVYRVDNFQNCNSEILWRVDSQNLNVKHLFPRRCGGRGGGEGGRGDNKGMGGPSFG